MKDKTMGRNEIEDTTAQTASRYSMFHIKQLWGAEENPAEILRVMALETACQAGGPPSPTTAKQVGHPRYLHYM